MSFVKWWGRENDIDEESFDAKQSEPKVRLEFKFIKQDMVQKQKLSFSVWINTKFIDTEQNTKIFIWLHQQTWILEI